MFPKLVFFVGHHNSGKTTLIERLAIELQKRGYTVGYVKHDPKGHGVTDKEGSDTDRMFRVVSKVALLSTGKLTLWERKEDDPMDVVKEYFKGFDIVLLEGWKTLEGVKRVVVGDLSVEGFKVDKDTPLEYIISYVLEG